MGFKFDSTIDADFSKTFNGLINHNDGFFKSTKQKTFLLKQMEIGGDVNQYFGVDGNDKTYYKIVGGHVSWADYGRQSIRPVGYLFTFDEHGVIGKYKLHYHCPHRGGWHVNQNKTEVVWTRSETAVPPVFEEPIKEAPVTTVIAAVGAKISLSVEIVRVIEFPKTPMFYYDSSIGYKTEMKDVKTGAKVVYWGKLKNKEDFVDFVEGDVVSLTCKMKAVGEYRGSVENVVSHPKAKKVEINE